MTIALNEDIFESINMKISWREPTMTNLRKRESLLSINLREKYEEPQEKKEEA